MATSNFPTPPQKTYNFVSFPNDLEATGRKFKTDIQFLEYSGAFALDSVLNSGSTYTPTTGITLPLPRRINDSTSVEWSRSSLIELAISLASSSKLAQSAGAFRDAASAGTGQQFNPFQFMVFKHTNFKEHILSWTLSPTTPEESNTIKYIIDQFKFHMLPTTSGALMQYPSIAIVKLYPNNEYTFRFRPCAIAHVEVDFTGGGMPSFFRNGAPSVVNLTVYLKEITLWDKTNFYSGS